MRQALAIRPSYCDGCRERDEHIRQLEDTLGKRTIFDRTRLKLTTKQCEMTALFLRRSFWTRQGIFLAIYGDEQDIDPKIIDVFMVRIRRALRPLGIEIDTQWGDGWRMARDHRIKLRSFLVEIDDKIEPGDLPGVAPWK
jgi:two-component system cell cycle response regulator CtrA